MWEKFKVWFVDTTDAVFTVWFGILAVVTYISLLALSECFTSDKERVWWGYDYE